MLGAEGKIGRWTCSSGDVKNANGQICCNSDVEDLLKKSLSENGGVTKKTVKSVAVALRKKLESEEGGYWEAVVSQADFAFANYLVEQFHCRVEDDEGRTAMVWQALVGGGGDDEKKEEAGDH